MIKIAPSILAANVLRLEEEVEAVLEAGADLVHLDIMDQHYVPNLSFGPAFCKQLRECFPKLILDVHLMVKPVEDLIISFAKAGASRISIHPDACENLHKALSLIQELGCEVGLALNPSMSTDHLRETADLLDFVLVMTVHPGFGGQQLIQSCIPKIAAIKQTYPTLPISVDGGVNLDTIHSLAQAGCENFIVGAGLFGLKPYQKTIQLLKKRALNNA